MHAIDFSCKKPDAFIIGKIRFLIMRAGTFHIITFGCQMNVHDSQWLTAALEKQGYSRTAMEEAQLVIINTCSVRQKPEEKVRSALGRIKTATCGSRDVCVAICGCVAQQLGKKLFEYSPQVRLVAGTDGIAAMPQTLLELLEAPAKKLLLLDFAPAYVERPQLEIGGASAFVAIMQGCDNFCAYCIVPFTRGRQKSRQEHEILEECGRRLARGAREITLLGQNVNAWGKDNGQGSFAGLLRKIAALPGLERLHYITPHPKDMTAEDARVFGELPVLCPRLHLPLQSGSDKVLAAMRRRYSSREYLDLVETLKNARPDIALSTDIIVGFPGESEADFLATLELLRKCSFVSSFSFCYSDRPGARAALFPHKIPPALQQDRLLRFQAMQEEITEKWLAGRVGQKALVLLEGKSPRQADGQESWQGRDEYGAIVHVPVNEAFAGQMIACRIEAARRHSLVGRQEG